MVVRVQAQNQSWVWLYMVLQLQPGEIPISSNNYIIRCAAFIQPCRDFIWRIHSKQTSDVLCVLFLLSPSQ